MSNNEMALFMFVIGTFTNIGVAINVRNSGWSVPVWVIAGLSAASATLIFVKLITQN